MSKQNSIDNVRIAMKQLIIKRMQQTSTKGMQ